jgi:hypothetical protein
LFVHVLLVTNKQVTKIIDNPDMTQAVVYVEDIRMFTFPPLAPREDLLPTWQQSQAAQTLVQTLDLAASGEEVLQPESTANPTLQRFYRALGLLALGQHETPGGDEEVPCFG